MRDILESLKLITLALAIGLGLNYAYAAWSGPTSAPPNDNTPAPINVGDSTQVKSGSFEIDTSFSYVPNDPDEYPRDALLSWLNNYNRGFVANKNFNGTAGEKVDVGIMGLGLTAGVRGDGNFAGVIASANTGNGYDFYGLGPQSRFAKVISSEYCFGSGQPGTDCITEWPEGGGVENLLLEGYEEKHWNFDEDTYSSWVGGGGTDTCNGISTSAYVCSPSEDKTCTDITPDSDEGHDHRLVQCNSTKILVKKQTIPWADRANQGLYCSTPTGGGAATLYLKVSGSGVPSSKIDLSCYGEFGSWSTTTGWLSNVTDKEFSAQCQVPYYGGLYGKISASTAGIYGVGGYIGNTTCANGTWVNLSTVTWDD